jgi:hypothetical protein
LKLKKTRNIIKMLITGLNIKEDEIISGDGVEIVEEGV